MILLKKIIVEPNSPTGSIFTYLTDDFLVDDNNFIVFIDNRGTKRMIPFNRVIEVIIDE